MSRTKAKNCWLHREEIPEATAFHARKKADLGADEVYI